MSRDFSIDVRGELVHEVTNPLENLVDPEQFSTAKSANGTLLGDSSMWFSNPNEITGANIADARTGMTLSVNAPSGSYAGLTNTYQYDGAGRQVTEASVGQIPGQSITTSTYTRTYDAEDHLINAPCGPVVGCTGELSSFTWGPDGRLRQIVVSGGAAGYDGTQSEHWDGDTLLFSSVHNVPGATALYIGKLGKLTSTGFSVADRDQTGTLQASHSSGQYTQWAIGPVLSVNSQKVAGTFYQDPGYCPTGTVEKPCPISAPGVYLEARRTDGYTYSLGGFEIQGARIFDPTSAQWLTPDAYAGDVQDPTSQKPFMWNKNNPIEYADPSGYDPVSESVRAALAVAAAAEAAAAAAAAASAAAAAAPFVAAGAAIGVFIAPAPTAPGTLTPAERAQQAKAASSNRLPLTGPPNTIGVREDGQQTRTYGPNGGPQTDIDYGHPHHHPGVGSPHAHDWVQRPDGSWERGEIGRTPTPEELQESQDSINGAQQPQAQPQPQSPPKSQEPN